MIFRTASGASTLARYRLTAALLGLLTAAKTLFDLSLDRRRGIAATS